MDLPTRLKELRKARGLTQPQLAEAVNQTPSSISAYEKGKRIPQADAIIKLADFFNVSTDYLLGIDADPNSATGPIIDLIPFTTREYPVLNEELPEIVEKMKCCCDGSFDTYGCLEADFCIFVRDDTMSGFGINDGDIAFVEQATLDFIDTLDIVAIVKDRRAIIRRIVTDIPDLLMFEASDRYTDPIIVDMTDVNNQIMLIGKVVGIQRML